MDEKLAELKEKHRMKLDELLIKYKYRFYRYGLEFSLLFCYAREDFDLSPYFSLVRLTDSFVKLENNFYAIVHEGVNVEKSLKGGQNIIRRFKSDNHDDENIYLSAVSVTETSMDNDMVEHLFATLSNRMKEKV